ncbi:MAG: tetratricopeptide repeat protein [Prevotellaceae bacterium]|jgi:tetratricopeptide (TPR) repeat protein|nr:tetratricopeptide repeat protein [Prevotellaceae bacterium]
MKKILLLSVLMISAGILTAQTNLGVDYYLLGDYAAAKTYFEKNMNTNAAESNFYLGEIAFKEGNVTAAKSFYDKGLSADQASLYNQIGLLKLQVKGNNDLKTLDKQFAAIQKMAKKDVDVAIAIARAYLDNGKFVEANAKLEAAKKINKKAPQVCILAGDIIFATGDKNQLGAAAAQYEMSNTFDANYALGYVKSAQIYESLNATLAVTLLKTDTERNPNYLIAFRELGKIYIDRGNYPTGIENYKKFFTGNAYTIADIERLARAYYFSKPPQYIAAQELIDKGLAMAPNDYVLNRYNMYIAAQENKIAEGLQAAEKFFAIPYNSPHLPTDYSNYALLLLGNNQPAQAFVEFDKGLAVDSMKFENPTTRSEVAKQQISIIRDAVDAARAQKNYGLAADYFERYMKASGSNDASDLSNLWSSSYSAGMISANDSVLMTELRNSDETLNKIATPVERAAITADATLTTFKRYYKKYYLDKANVAADEIIQRLPDSYSGYRFKALTMNAINDKVEEGAAKSYYELMVEKILVRPDENGQISEAGKKGLIEAYNYLGYHYYLVNDRENSTNYCQKALEIDPNNVTAKTILDAYAQEKK